MENIHDLQSGKMCREPFPQTKEKISNPSLKRSSASKARMHRCLRLKNGPMPTAMWEMDGALHTELSMRGILEFPNAEEESTLSQILEVNVPLKYYLSQKACQGILRRAGSRGKELPPMLKQALEMQAQG